MRKVCSAWHMKLFLSGSLSFSFSFLVLLLPACSCFKFSNSTQLHDTPNYFTCSNFWLSFCDFSFCLSMCVCVLCDNFAIISFLPISFSLQHVFVVYIYFAVLSYSFSFRFVLFSLRRCFFFARNFLYNCVLELYRTQNVFVPFFVLSPCFGLRMKYTYRYLYLLCM